MNKFSKILKKKAKEKKQNDFEAIEEKTCIKDKNEKNRDEAEKVFVKHIVNNDAFAPEILALHEPKTNISEQYRILRTNIKSLSKKIKTLLISSSIEEEGKTVTSINLAYTFSLFQDRKVLLVDADLRRSSVKKYIKTDIAKVKDLLYLLRNNADYRDALVYTHNDNFQYINANLLNEDVNDAVELLESDHMQVFIDTVRREYDYIIFDTPPILPVTDAAIIGEKVDAALLVFKAGKTEKNTIKHAQDIFKQAGVELVGYIMTSVDALSMGGSDYYYYGGYRY